MYLQYLNTVLTCVQYLHSAWFLDGKTSIFSTTTGHKMAHNLAVFDCMDFCTKLHITHYSSHDSASNGIHIGLLSFTTTLLQQRFF